VGISTRSLYPLPSVNLLLTAHNFGLSYWILSLPSRIYRSTSHFTCHRIFSSIFGGHFLHFDGYWFRCWIWYTAFPFPVFCRRNVVFHRGYFCLLSRWLCTLFGRIYRMLYACQVVILCTSSIVFYVLVYENEMLSFMERLITGYTWSFFVIFFTSTCIYLQPSIYL